MAQAPALCDCAGMTTAALNRNIRLYPWFRAAHGLIFWQAVWFLYIQGELSAADAILMYAVYDITTTMLEVPSGYLSDRWGRRKTLIASASFGVLAAGLQAWGGSFGIFLLGNICLGASAALLSGTDTSLLYESLNGAGRKDEVEAQELKAWRFGFAALAASALIGGALWRIDPAVPYIASALAYAAALWIALSFVEPPHDGSEVLESPVATLFAALRSPVLLWLMGLSLSMYLFSHLPFVFGQPFILEALDRVGLSGEAPLISGGVTATMMGLSLVASLFAAGLRRRIGLAAILLLAFGMQIALVMALATSNALWVIGLLLLRMVPDSLSGPFILARIQPFLADNSRATYLSIQSLAGRLLFALTLVVSSSNTTDAGLMPYADISRILWWYAGAGLVVWLMLAALARRAGVEPRGAVNKI